MLPIRDINPTRITPVFTLIIIAANILVFLLVQPSADEPASRAPFPDEGTEFLYEQAAIACELTTGEPLTLNEVTGGPCVEGSPGEGVFPDKNIYLAAVISMFLHAGGFHIFGNMWFLWIFGNNVEEAFGNFGFLVLYLLGGLAATAAFVIANPETTIPLIGASGAVAAVLGSYLVLFPRHQVLSLIFVIFVPVPALLFLGFWFLSQFAIADASVAWEAHVAGFLFGALITLPVRSYLLNRVESLHATARYR